MKKSGCFFRYMLFFTIVTLLFASPAEAQVNVEELNIGNLGPVEFINFEGPFMRIESLEQIRLIGYELGLAVRSGIARPGALNRYFVIHSVSAADGFRLDADIFGLGVDVAVDHIRNLRLIIQGYLEGAYEYSASDAALLSHYITIYDAVYRGDWDHFSARYKNDVISSLTRERVGLAIRYDEWPGRTLAVIPLLMGPGGPLSIIDTSTLTDSRVLDQLRTEDDMSLDLRRDMVDLQEREADEAARLAEQAREALRQEEARIAEERRLAQLAEQEAREREQQARLDQQQLSREELDAAELAARMREAEERAQEALREQQEARERQEALDREAAELEALRLEAERQAAFAEQRMADAQEGRQEIAEDQQVLIRQEVPAQRASGLLALSIATPNSTLGRIVRIDPNTGMELMRSAISTVNVRTVNLVNNRLIAIAGENRGANAAIRLVEINTDTLEMQRQGDDNIAVESLLWVNGQDLYAIIDTDGQFYMARFNLDLSLQARSSLGVNPMASVYFSEGHIATQRADGSAIILDARSLAERR
ncbi:MAG: hypothetical protein FWG77_06230 [Treponema sp.]|nr:hypothetical protein [Treponema sp.]